jgi:hypothetical protein
MAGFDGVRWHAPWGRRTKAHVLAPRERWQPMRTLCGCPVHRETSIGLDVRNVDCRTCRRALARILPAKVGDPRDRARTSTSWDRYIALRTGWALGYLFRALEVTAEPPPSRDLLGIPHAHNSRGYLLRHADTAIQEALMALPGHVTDDDIDAIDEAVQLATDGHM